MEMIKVLARLWW